MSDVPFSDSKRAGDLLFTSGQLAFGPDRRISGDIAEQTRVAIANLERVIAAQNCTLADVVKTTIWLRNKHDFAAYNRAYAEAFGSERPARSTVIGALVFDEALIEIEAVVWRRNRA